MMTNSDKILFIIATLLMLVGLVFCGYVDIDYVKWNIIYYSILHILVGYLYMFIRFIVSEKTIKRLCSCFALLNVVYLINQLRFWNYNYYDYAANLNTNLLIKISSITSFLVMLIIITLCLRKK